MISSKIFDKQLCLGSELISADRLLQNLLLLFKFMNVGVKPGLHIVLTVAEHACDYVLKRVLKLLNVVCKYFL